MPFVPVPKDLSKVKTKLVFNLTKRQLICFSIAVAIGVPAYIFTRSTLGGEGAVMLMIVLMLPFFLMGLYERDGLPAEIIAANYIRANFLLRFRQVPHNGNITCATARLISGFGGAKRSVL